MFNSKLLVYQRVTLVCSQKKTQKFSMAAQLRDSVGKSSSGKLTVCDIENGRQNSGFTQL